MLTLREFLQVYKSPKDIIDDNYIVCEIYRHLVLETQPTFMKININKYMPVGEYGEIVKPVVINIYTYLRTNMISYDKLNGHNQKDLNRSITKKHRRMTIEQLCTYADFMTKNSPSEFSDIFEIVNDIVPMELGVVGNIAYILAHSKNEERRKEAQKFMTDFYRGKYDKQKITKKMLVLAHHVAEYKNQSLYRAIDNAKLN